MNHTQVPQGHQPLSLDEWLELSQQLHLNEEHYQKLVESLPKDPETRASWFQELSIHHALNEHHQQLKPSELKEWLRKAKSSSIQQQRIHRMGRNNIWPKALAATAVAGLLLTLIQPFHFEPDLKPQDIYKKDDRDAVTVVTLFEESEETHEKIEPYEIATLSLETSHAINTPIEQQILNYDDSKNIAADMAEIAEAPIDMLATVQDAPMASAHPMTTRSNLPKELAKLGRSRKISGHISEIKSKKLGLSPSINNNESYRAPKAHDFISTSKDNLSTFSIDVDTASYSNIRRMIREGRLPPKEAVRIEEMVNNFRYNYPLPQDDPPFSITTSLGDCPWNNNHQLLKVGLKGRIDENRPDVNLVFLLDVSGSMNSRDKLPLLKKSFKLLLDALRPTDTVAIVAYAGHTGVVLAPTKANERQKISEAMDKLQATGSTNGTGGLQLAYQLAQQKFSADSVNRVILATDGDFNVGISDHNKLQDFIEEKRKTGIELSVLGFGRGNVKDDTMELLANKGNGNYNYIDTVRSARKALVEEMASNLITIAKDVKIQMVFDPERVQSFRLIGYENRALAHRDFKDDTKDAGELGMGHTVTALYEIIPIQNISDHHPSIGRVKLRYKSPKGSSSQLVQKSISATTSGDRDQNFLWAIATAGWGEILRDSSHVNKEHLNRLITLARSAKGNDPMGYRSEMIQLMEISKDLLFLKNDEQLPLWQYRE